MTNPYADTAEAYFDAGWRGIIPLPAGQKKPAPAGYTGWAGEYPSWPDVQTWIDVRPQSNIALRLPPTVLGIDVDNYAGKLGAATLAACEAKWGALPPTWRSTSRDDGISGIRLYTVPAGLDWPGELPGGGVETVHSGHRYVVAAPSVHPNGAVYRWLYDDGVPFFDPTGSVPLLDALPALPGDWIIGLARGMHIDEPAADVNLQQWVDQHGGDTPCPAMHEAVTTAIAGPDGSSRHEHLLRTLYKTTRLAEEGHVGLTAALAAIRSNFLEAMTVNPRGTAHEAAAEYERALSGAVSKVEGSPSLAVTGDPCGHGTVKHSPAPTAVVEWAHPDPLADTLPVSKISDNRTSPTPPAIAATPGGRQVHLTSAANIIVRPVFWLWKGRLALGTLGVLAGREGLGKSTLAYWSAARITDGTLFGEFQGTPKSVLICATEDSWEHTIVPRLIAAGADLTRVFRVEVTNGDTTELGLSLPDDLKGLADAARQVDAALLLLDPLTSRLGDLDTHKDSEVRQALEPLVAVADAGQFAILGIMHHNKGGAADPLQLVMGSKAFTAVARSVHTVIADPDDDTNRRRLFGTPKNNLGRDDLPTFSFTIAGHGIETAEGTAWTSYLEWGEESAEAIATTMRRASEAGDSERQLVLSEAAEWLLDYLSDRDRGGQAPRSEVVKVGAAEGHSLSALNRARVKLGVTASRKGFGGSGGSVWCLPEAAVTNGDAA